MKYELKNEQLTVGFDTKGAEMISLKGNKSGQEYLWNADGKFWGRHSPVLFPIVGRVRDNTYRYDGQEYHLSQHGFARDMEFECISQKAEEIWFRLNATAETKKNYPFEFRLEIGYRLENAAVRVMWKVTNMEKEKAMYFSIGAHPAFMCPLKEGEKQRDYGMVMDAQEEVMYSFIGAENGLMFNHENRLRLDYGYHSFVDGFFDESAYIIENCQVKKVSLVDPQKKPYITVSFQAPVVGIWSPEKKQAPFVCIEPWYGRCDRENFEGTLEEREWGNKLNPQEVFEQFYDIKVEQ